jgi:translation initiation factor 3 subunit H
VQVQLDGLVILKIIKHCQESYPEAVAGSLLGLDVGDVLEVTHSFASPNTSNEEEAPESDEFELDMMRALREVNIDNNHVGWYQSTYLGSYCTKDTILHQFDYQESLPFSVLLVYDGVRTSQGQLSIKALRLTDTFCDAYRNKRINVDTVSSLSSSSIFEEIPIKIRNSTLLQAFIVDLTESSLQKDASLSSTSHKSGPAAIDSSLSNLLSSSSAIAATSSNVHSLNINSSNLDIDVDFSRLDLTTAPFLEKHLELMTDVSDQLLKAQSDVSTYQRKVEAQKRYREEWISRRRAENELRKQNGEDPLPEEDLSLPFFRPIPPPMKGQVDPLDTLLMQQQILTYAGQVNRFASQSFGKLFLAGSLHKS